MSRAEFIACSLAFHAVLLVVALLLPAPFPSVPYTATDLSYVELADMPAPAGEPSPGDGPVYLPGRDTYLETSEDSGEAVPPAASPDTARPRPGGRMASEPAQPAGAPGSRQASDRTSHTGQAGRGRAETPDTKPAPPSAIGAAASAPEISALATPDSGARRVATGRRSLNFRYQKGWPVPTMAGVDVDAPGTGWKAEPDSGWIVVTPGTGRGAGRLNVGVVVAGLAVGYHDGVVRIKPDSPGIAACELPVSVMVLPEDPGTPELPHTAWDDYMDGNCKVCHLPEKLMPSRDFMKRPEFCGLCHNPNGMAAGSIPGPGGHPVMVNATSGGARMPTGGTVADGAYSDRMATHMLGGRVVCVTCHNVMYKPGDRGRTWELASADDARTYRLSKGGWSGMGYLVPKVYVTGRLMPLPDRLSGLRAFQAGPSAYEYDEDEGTITFKKPLEGSRFVYVTLSNPYLRRTTANNALCFDCHSENTHAALNCLVCHTAHGTRNIKAVRDIIRIPSGTGRRVVFRAMSGAGSFADGRGAADGICEACHRHSGGRIAHPGGRDYSGWDCTTCHSHANGFMPGAKARPRR